MAASSSLEVKSAVLTMLRRRRITIVGLEEKFSIFGYFWWLPFAIWKYWGDWVRLIIYDLLCSLILERISGRWMIKICNDLFVLLTVKPASILQFSKVMVLIHIAQTFTITARVFLF